MLSTLFLIGCISTVLAVLAVLDWSAAPCVGWPAMPRPKSWGRLATGRAYLHGALASLIGGFWCHLRGLGRLGVMAGAAMGAARAAEGWSPPADVVLFMWAVSVVYWLQAREEALRQGRARDARVRGTSIGGRQ